MMLFFESLKLAFSAIRVNKMRSFLTMLGMIIGISSVIAIVSIGDTMRGVMAQQYDLIGINRALVYVGYMGDDFRMSDYYTLDEFEQLRQAFPEQIDYLDANAFESSTMTKGRNTYKVEMQGVRGGYDKVQPMDIIYGRMINESDVERKKLNVVMEDKTAVKLFGTENAVGKTIRITIKGEVQDVTIVGIYHTPQSFLSAMMGSNNNDLIYVPEPLITWQDGYYFSANIYVNEHANLDVFKKQFVGMVARMKNRQPENIVYYAARDEMSSMDSMMQSLSMAVGAIAAISLVVGGIGIMNIMLVSVTERTREIGIRKALGARTKDVLLQFLIESAIISAVGGAIGTALGLGIVLIGGSLIGVPVVINPEIIVMAVAFSAIVGIFFGIYPASKAAKADPITALRYE